MPSKVRERSELAKKKWPSAENSKLLQHVDTHGAMKWSLVSSCLPGRSAQRCRERYLHDVLTNGVADPNLGISPFALLNHRWLDHFDFRRAWGFMSNHPENFRKRPWEKDEGSIILDSVDSNVCDNKDQPGANQWARISKQLRGRYLYHSLYMLSMRSAVMRFKTMFKIEYDSFSLLGPTPRSKTTGMQA